jgi:hypothetical protein
LVVWYFWNAGDLPQQWVWVNKLGIMDGGIAGGRTYGIIVVCLENRHKETEGEEDEKRNRWTDPRVIL